MTPETAGHVRVEDRGRRRAALEVHFGEEEEGDDDDDEMTGGYVGNQAKRSQTPDPVGDVSPAPASDNGADASEFSTTSLPIPPSSGTDVRKNSTGGEVVRTTVPNYGLWKLDALKTKCLRLVGSRQELGYGPSPVEVLKIVSDAKKEQGVNALLEHADSLHKLREDPEWVCTPFGITLEKAMKRQRVRNSTDAKPGGRGAGVSKSESYCCRLACLTLRPPL